jgi:hypothetical protein
MKKIIVFMSLSLISSFAFARGEGSGRMRAFATYGLAAVNPTDINGITAGPTYSPAVGKISTASSYTFGLGYMIHPRVELFAYYDMQNAYQKGNTNFPSGQSGFELWAQSVWAGANFVIMGNDRADLFVGAAAGLPIYLHARESYGNFGNFDFDGNKSVNFLGQVGVDVRVTSMVAVEILGGYQSVTSSTLTSTGPGGGTLNTNGSFGGGSTGTAAKLDLSGGFGKAGLKVMF